MESWGRRIALLRKLVPSFPHLKKKKNIIKNKEYAGIRCFIYYKVV